jgi:hypothetical protein
VAMERDSIHGERITSEANYTVIRTKYDGESTVFNVGYYRDVIVRNTGGIEIPVAPVCLRQRNDRQLHHLPHLRTQPWLKNWIDAAALSDVPQGDVIAVQGGWQGDRLVRSRRRGLRHRQPLHPRPCPPERRLPGRPGNRVPAAPGQVRRLLPAQALCAPLTENIKTYTVRIDKHARHVEA